MSWAITTWKEQYFKHNICVTVDFAEPALGSHLVNQTDPQRSRQNDPVKAYEFSKFAYKLSKFGAYNIEAICSTWSCSFTNVLDLLLLTQEHVEFSSRNLQFEQTEQDQGASRNNDKIYRKSGWNLAR